MLTMKPRAMQAEAKASLSVWSGSLSTETIPGQSLWNILITYTDKKWCKIKKVEHFAFFDDYWLIWRYFRVKRIERAAPKAPGLRHHKRRRRGVVEKRHLFVIGTCFKLLRFIDLREMRITGCTRETSLSDFLVPDWFGGCKPFFFSIANVLGHL